MMPGTIKAGILMCVGAVCVIWILNETASSQIPALQRRGRGKAQEAGEETRVICCYLDTSMMDKVPNKFSKGH